jgi:hypothetical protein
VRYLFRGTRRQTGEPVEGRVTAPTQDAALDVLHDGGIVADALDTDPATEGDAAGEITEPRFARALERALDDAGFRVNFDLVTGRYQGKSVSLLDQDKIRKRVMELVADTAVDDLPDDKSRPEARRHITQLLEELLESRLSLGAEGSARSPELEAQVCQISEALGRLERAMASMSLAVRRGGHAPPRHSESGQGARDKRHDEVLIEVFENNLELRKGLKEPASLPALGGGQAPTHPV